MKVYKGTNGRNERISWIEPRIVLQLEVHELVDGLCSKYFRNRTDGDDPLPDVLSAEEIVTAVKDEYAYYGTNAVWTWFEEGFDHDTIRDENAAREWAEGLILTAFPELGATS